jgi:hypothetical protein
MLKFNPLNRNRSANTKMKSPGFAQPLSSNIGRGSFHINNSGSTNDHLRNVLESPKFRPDLLSKNDNPPEVIAPSPVK